jgi:AmmeMemoRadiSam system protein B
VAGQFYPHTKSALSAFLQANIDPTHKKNDAVAAIMPHAGYIYSGKTAAHTIARINVTDTVLLLGPNHTGKGEQFAIRTEGTWATPLGQVSIDQSLAAEILKGSNLIHDDDAAHRAEHSLEVQLPFLQAMNPRVAIVPLAVGTHNLERLRIVAEVIAAVLKGKNVLMLVSSDMTHYESKKSATEKDKLAIDAIIDLNETELARVVSQRNITMCGFAPTYIAIIAAKILGARRGALIEYTTSGEVTGDDEQVVGYAGIIIK